MKTHCTLLFISLFIISCKVKTSLVSDKLTIEKRFIGKLDSIYRSNPETVGIMVHLESPNKKISWSGAVGYSNKSDKTKVQINQPVLIASNTKTYVAATILRLAEEGEVLLNAPINKYLSESTKLLLQNKGYDISSIRVLHLLSHTSGLNNYAESQEFRDKMRLNPTYRWTRQEQIGLAVVRMDKLANAGEKFHYSDTNYLLLSEIIEEVTHLKFYEAIRRLINFDKHGLNETWFASLENDPKNIDPLAHQYYGKLGIDSYGVDKSFDLYGGGGLASTSKDMAVFYYKLFNKKVFRNPQTVDTLLTKVDTKQIAQTDYRFGLLKTTLKGKIAYGHGGFWGSMVYYLPELDLAVSVIVLEKDKNNLRKEIAEAMISDVRTQNNR